VAHGRRKSLKDIGVVDAVVSKGRLGIGWTVDKEDKRADSAPAGSRCARLVHMRRVLVALCLLAAGAHAVPFPNIEAPSPRRPKVTAVVLNWQRLRNVVHIVETSLCSPELNDVLDTVVVWNNNPRYHLTRQVRIDLCHMLGRVHWNALLCSISRWHLALPVKDSKSSTRQAMTTSSRDFSPALLPRQTSASFKFVDIT